MVQQQGSAQQFEIQGTCWVQSPLSASERARLESHRCAAGPVASGPGPLLRPTPAFAIPRADADSAGSRPDVPVALRLGILSHSWPGGSHSLLLPGLGLGSGPPGLLFSAVFFPFPRASATGNTHREGRHTEHHSQCTAPPGQGETEAEHPKGHCSPPQGAAQATSPLKQVTAGTQAACSQQKAPSTRPGTLRETAPEPNIQIHE